MKAHDGYMTVCNGCGKLVHNLEMATPTRCKACVESKRRRADVSSESLRLADAWAANYATHLLTVGPRQ